MQNACARIDYQHALHIIQQTDTFHDDTKSAFKSNEASLELQKLNNVKKKISLKY